MDKALVPFIKAVNATMATLSPTNIPSTTETIWKLNGSAEIPHQWITSGPSATQHEFVLVMAVIGLVVCAMILGVWLYKRRARIVRAVKVLMDLEGGEGDQHQQQQQQQQQQHQHNEEDENDRDQGR